MGLSKAAHPDTGTVVKVIPAAQSDRFSFQAPAPASLVMAGDTSRTSYTSTSPRRPAHRIRPTPLRLYRATFPSPTNHAHQYTSGVTNSTPIYWRNARSYYVPTSSSSFSNNTSIPSSFSFGSPPYSSSVDTVEGYATPAARPVATRLTGPSSGRLSDGPEHSLPISSSTRQALDATAPTPFATPLSTTNSASHRSYIDDSLNSDNSGARRYPAGYLVFPASSRSSTNVTAVPVAPDLGQPPSPFSSFHPHYSGGVRQQLYMKPSRRYTLQEQGSSDMSMHAVPSAANATTAPSHRPTFSTTVLPAAVDSDKQERAVTGLHSHPTPPSAISSSDSSAPSSPPTPFPFATSPVSRKRTASAAQLVPHPDQPMDDNGDHDIDRNALLSTSSPSSKHARLEVTHPSTTAHRSPHLHDIDAALLSAAAGARDEVEMVRVKLEEDGDASGRTAGKGSESGERQRGNTPEHQRGRRVGTSSHHAAGPISGGQSTSRALAGSTSTSDSLKRPLSAPHADHPNKSRARPVGRHSIGAAAPPVEPEGGEDAPTPLLHVQAASTPVIHAPPTPSASTSRRANPTSAAMRPVRSDPGPVQAPRHPYSKKESHQHKHSLSAVDKPPLRTYPSDNPRNMAAASGSGSSLASRRGAEAQEKAAHLSIKTVIPSIRPREHGRMQSIPEGVQSLQASSHRPALHMPGMQHVVMASSQPSPTIAKSLNSAKATPRQSTFAQAQAQANYFAETAAGHTIYQSQMQPQTAMAQSMSSPRTAGPSNIQARPGSSSDAGMHIDTSLTGPPNTQAFQRHPTTQTQSQARRSIPSTAPLPSAPIMTASMHGPVITAYVSDPPVGSPRPLAHIAPRNMQVQHQQHHSYPQSIPNTARLASSMPATAYPVESGTGGYRTPRSMRATQMSAYGNLLDSVAILDDQRAQLTDSMAGLQGTLVQHVQDTRASFDRYERDVMTAMADISRQLRDEVTHFKETVSVEQQEFERRIVQLEEKVGILVNNRTSSVATERQAESATLAERFDALERMVGTLSSSLGKPSGDDTTEAVTSDNAASYPSVLRRNSASSLSQRSRPLPGASSVTSSSRAESSVRGKQS